MTTENRTVGIIANPASGKDIRRLVAQGSVFDNNEKVNIVRRLLLGLEAAGVTQVLFMPDYFHIIERALEGIKLNFAPRMLDMVMYSNQDDSTEAARLMAEAEAACIITLGGDGTNRAVVKGSAAVPLIPISTGTNNVFPSMVEGTLAGLAAGVVASEIVPLEEVATRTNRLDVLVDGEPEDLALVDIAVYDDAFVGARAVWEMSKVRALFLSRAAPAAMGLSSIGGMLNCRAMDSRHGMYIRLAETETAQAVNVTAPVAPGMVRPVRITGFRLLEVGETVSIEQVPSVLALDGEREIEVGRRKKITVRFSNQGPWVIEVDRVLAAAAERSYFRSSAGAASIDPRCILAQLGICETPCT